MTRRTPARSSAANKRRRARHMDAGGGVPQPVLEDAGAVDGGVDAGENAAPMPPA